jgi:hypothetical protein
VPYLNGFPDVVTTYVFDPVALYAAEFVITLNPFDILSACTPHVTTFPLIVRETGFPFKYTNGPAAEAFPVNVPFIVIWTLGKFVEHKVLVPAGIAFENGCWPKL